jgi:hypothetical protein
MQPEPSELSTDILNTLDAQDPDNTSQHGFLPNELHSADLRDHLPDGSAASGCSIRASDVIETQLSDEAELHEEQLRGLSFGGSHETRSKPSFQRISEYENALSPSTPRRQYEGPGFKIINKKGNRLDGPQLVSFPNGTNSLHFRSSLCNTII